MVFQSYALYPHLTVAENLAFHMQVKKVDKATQKNKVQHIASMLGIDKLLGRYPRALSGGQRQRVAMGRAMVRNPQVFLFDEPLSNLDAQLRMELRAEIKSLHQRFNTTMIYVTHDQVEAMTLADQIVVMLDGVIVQQGAPLEIYDRPCNTFVARFIGSPPMNLLEGQIQQRDGQPGVQCGELWLALPERWYPAAARQGQAPVIVGLRPQDIQPADEGGRQYCRDHRRVHAAASRLAGLPNPCPGRRASRSDYPSALIAGGTARENPSFRRRQRRTAGIRTLNLAGGSVRPRPHVAQTAAIA